MSQNFIDKSSDYDSSGPRPPVPGQEEKRYKVTFIELNLMYMKLNITELLIL